MGLDVSIAQSERLVNLVLDLGEAFADRFDPCHQGAQGIIAGVGFALAGLQFGVVSIATNAGLTGLQLMRAFTLASAGLDQAGAKLGLLLAQLSGLADQRKSVGILGLDAHAWRLP